MHRTKIYFPVIILSLSDSNYPTVPIKFGYTGSWRRVITPIHANTTVYAVYTATGSGGGGGEIIIPPQPTSPGEIMSGGEGEPVEADAPAEDETVSPQGMHVTGTQTVTHEYLTLNGKVARETIRTNNTLTAVLDFIYDESGKPFALKYSTDGATFDTYYYVLNLQGDVVQIIDEGGVLQAEYVYSPWGEVISAEGDLAEINPLRYRGYYYDSETGFYYLQSRYYDPENHRFINADSLTSTGQGFLGTNMFAYCRNSPVLLADDGGQKWYYTVEEVNTEVVGEDERGTAKYKVTLKYTGYAPSYQIFVPDTTTSGEMEIVFSVDSRGVAVIENDQRDDLMLDDDAVSTAVAEEILKTAKAQVDGAMSGRTVAGWAREIRFHCKYGYLTRIKRIRSADMGGTDKSRSDYDYNAKGFENPLKIPIVIFEFFFN